MAKHDNTKVRELSPAQATREGLRYHDLVGDLRGYCYCCGRIGFKIDPAGNLSRHGFTRPRWQGVTFGQCYGSKHTPEVTLALAIDAAERQAAHLAGLLATDLVAHAIAMLELGDASSRSKYGWGLQGFETKLAHLREGTVPSYQEEEYWTPAGKRRELLDHQKRNATWLADLLKVRDGATR